MTDNKLGRELQYRLCPPDDATIQWNSREFGFGDDSIIVVNLR